MYTLYICLLALLIPNGFSLIAEETDLDSLSNYDPVDELDENFEIWNGENDNNEPGIIIFDSISRKLLEDICKDSNALVYITKDDITVDCKSYNKNDQPIEQKENIVKREAGDENEEGSGDGSPLIEENIEKETENQNNTDGADKEETKADDQSQDAISEDNKDEQPQEANPTEENNQSQDVAEEENKDDQVEDVSNRQENEENNQTEATPVEDLQPNQEKENEESPQNEPQEEIIPPIEVTTVPATVPNKIIDEINPTEVADVVTAKSEETGDGKIEERKDEPTESDVQVFSDIGENKQSLSKNDDYTAHGEKSGKSLIEPAPKESEASNALDNNDVKTDESTENTKQAGNKDTTILIVLFVAVVAVGALAFAYNFIKKRKQRASNDSEGTERASPIKRSLQNLTKIDGEPEKKPLIGDVKEVEMVNMNEKNSTTAKENGKNSSDHTL